MVTVSRYDAQGNLVGYSTYRFGHPERRGSATHAGAGCALGIFAFCVLFLWPLGILGTGVGDAIAVFYWVGWVAFLVGAGIHSHMKASGRRNPLPPGPFVCVKPPQKREPVPASPARPASMMSSQDPRIPVTDLRAVALTSRLVTAPPPPPRSR